MNSSSFPIDNHATLVADASVVINLNATGHALDIIRSFSGSLVVTENAFTELASGAPNGHSDDKKLMKLVDADAVRLVQLGESGRLVYASLVEGSTSRTLDDGEAATIGYAQETGGVAMIDEKKARVICANEFPDLTVVSTIDLLTHEAVRSALGKEGQIRAILNALHKARMRVPPHQIELIINLIGREAAATCRSLPKAVQASNTLSTL